MYTLERSMIVSVVMAVVCVCAGCADQPGRGEVSGVVTTEGKPLGGVVVEFLPDPEKETPGMSSFARTDDAGRYEVHYDGDQERPGATVGWHRVVLHDPLPEDSRGSPTPVLPRIGEPYLTPARTPLKYEVRPGSQTIDIEVRHDKD